MTAASYAAQRKCSRHGADDGRERARVHAERGIANRRPALAKHDAAPMTAPGAPAVLDTPERSTGCPAGAPNGIRFSAAAAECGARSEGCCEPPGRLHLPVGMSKSDYESFNRSSISSTVNTHAMSSTAGVVSSIVEF
jgi:hypothetical protein